jgi:hypothetical protein
MSVSMRVRPAEIVGIICLTAAAAAFSQLYLPRLLSAQSNTWQYAAAFDQLRVDRTHDAFFPELAAAPIHGGLLWWASLLPSSMDSVELYGRLSLGMGALRIFFLWLATVLMRLPPVWRLAMVAVSCATFAHNPPACSEPSVQAMAMGTAALAATMAAVCTGRLKETAVAGGLAGLTTSTHLPDGFFTVILLVAGMAGAMFLKRASVRPSQWAIAISVFVLVAFPILVSAAHFSAESRSWEGKYHPWQAFHYWSARWRLMDVGSPEGYLLLLLALLAGGKSSFPSFTWGVILTGLTLALPPCQYILTWLLNAATASHVLILVPTMLFATERLASLPRLQLSILWTLRAALALAAFFAVWQARGIMQTPANPAHGFSSGDIELSALIRGKVVVTDPWTAFTGRSYWGCYGIGYPEDHATTPPDSSIRREKVTRLFYESFDPTEAAAIAREYRANLLLVNHKLERGETDPWMGRGVSVPIDRLVRTGWTVVYSTPYLTLLRTPDNLEFR